MTVTQVILDWFINVAFFYNLIYLVSLGQKSELDFYI